MVEQTAVQTQTFDFLFRTTSDGVLVARDNVLRQVNPAAAALLGQTAEELVGRRVGDAFTLNPALVNLFQRPGDQTLDVRLPRRRLALGVGKSLESGERVVLLQDVTEKRDLESRREALGKAVAHDLRNPLTAIGGFADLVVKFGDLNEQQNRFLTRIRQTASKLHDVVGSLVDLAWIEAGMPLAHRPTQLPEVINNAVVDVGSQALDGRVTIATSIQNPMPVVMGDPDRLRIVIRNLLENAIAYSDRDELIVIHAWEDNNEVYCSVADRGIGIADDEIPLIFDRMYRGRDERVRETPGGGLGLTMARTIINRHGGDIWASSNFGQGSTFTFVLPTIRLEPALAVD